MMDTFTSITLLSTIFTFISTLGFSRLADYITSTWEWLKTGGNAQRLQKAKWNELRSLRAQLASLSPQDEFARWARLQRNLDKAQAEYDRVNGELSRDASSGKFKTSMALRVLYYAAMGASFGWHFRGQRVELPIGLGRGGILSYLPSWLISMVIKEDNTLSVYVYALLAQQAISRILSILIPH